MIKLIATIAITLITFSAWGQEPTIQPVKRLYRIRIQHADPQLVYLLLRGLTDFQHGPEISLGPDHGQGQAQGGGRGQGGR